MYYKSDDLSRYTDLATGAVQIAAIRAADWNLVTSNPQKYSYVTLPSWAGIISMVDINTNLYPTNITAVRQAIVHAINYSDISQKVFFGQTSPFVGPEYPSWKSLYDLGNFTPYQTNLTLAQNDLAEANISNMPSLTLRVPTICSACFEAAQIVQADLGDIGLNVNLEIVSAGNFYSVYGSYSTNLNNSAQIGQLSVDCGGRVH